MIFIRRGVRGNWEIWFLLSLGCLGDTQVGLSSRQLGRGWDISCGLEGLTSVSVCSPLYVCVLASVCAHSVCVCAYLHEHVLTSVCARLCVCTHLCVCVLTSVSEARTGPRTMPAWRGLERGARSHKGV